MAASRPRISVFNREVNLRKQTFVQAGGEVENRPCQDALNPMGLKQKFVRSPLFGLLTVSPLLLFVMLSGSRPLALATVWLVVAYVVFAVLIYMLEAKLAKQGEKENHSHNDARSGSRIVA